MTKRDEAMQMLDQMEQMLKVVSYADENRMPTMKAFLVVARVVYWLLERWIREEDKNGK